MPNLQEAIAQFRSLVESDESRRRDERRLRVGYGDDADAARLKRAKDRYRSPPDHAARQKLNWDRGSKLVDAASSARSHYTYFKARSLARGSELKSDKARTLTKLSSSAPEDLAKRKDHEKALVATKRALKLWRAKRALARPAEREIKRNPPESNSFVQPGKSSRLEKLSRRAQAQSNDATHGLKLGTLRKQDISDRDEMDEPTNHLLSTRERRQRNSENESDD